MQEQAATTKVKVEEIACAPGVPVTVLRAAMIVGSGSASFEILRYLVERLPVMITPKWVSTPCQPIAVENVIAYLVGVLSVPETIGSAFDIGGAETLCYSEIMRVMAEELGLPRRWIIPVPVLTPRLSSYWIHLVTPLSHKIAIPLAEGLKNPVVCRVSHRGASFPLYWKDLAVSIPTDNEKHSIGGAHVRNSQGAGAVGVSTADRIH